MKQLTTITLLALALGLSPGCSCDGDSEETPDASDVPDANETDAALRQVAGTRVFTYLTSAGETTEPADLSSSTIEALVDDGSGGYRTIAGVGLADGTFTIADVPEGSYLLRIDDVYRHTTSSSPDLGFAVLGRPDAAPATQQTDVTFDITNLDPWQLGDRLDFFAPNAAASEFGLEGTLSVDLNENDVAINAIADWNTILENNLVSATAGDIGYLLHMSSVTNDGENYVALTQVAEFNNIEITDGQPATIAGALTNPALDQTVDVTFDAATWAPLLADLGPDDFIQASPSISVYTSPFGLDHGDQSFIELANFTAQAGVAHDFTMSYAHPFPNDFAPYEFAGTIQAGFLDAPTNTIFAVGFMNFGGQLGSISANVTPRLGPVTAPTVEGSDATSPLSIAQPSPTVSWSPPSVGTPDVYFVGIRHIASAGFTRGVRVATLMTTDTSIVVPPGILESGQRYYFEISAVRQPGTDYDQAPIQRSGVERDSATRPTALITIE